MAVRQQRPGLELYSDDGGHPSLLGSYLAASVLYAAMFRESPESTTGSADEQFLRRVAWTTAQPFLR